MGDVCQQGGGGVAGRSESTTSPSRKVAPLKGTKPHEIHIIQGGKKKKKSMEIIGKEEEKENENERPMSNICLEGH